MTDTLPVLGAALAVADLAAHESWLREAPRDLELQDFVSVELLEGGWQERADTARRALEGHAGRLGIHGPFWGFTIASFDPAVRGIVTRRMMQALDVCDRLGATQIVIHSPYTTWAHNNLDAGKDERGRIIEAARATLAEPLARAAESGVTFVLENIEDIDPAERAGLAAALGWQALALSVDTGHAHYAHVSTGAAPVDFFLRAAGARLAHVHLQDSEGYADRHWPIGRGTIRWHAVFGALAETGADARLILELRDKSGVIPSSRTLSSLGLAR